MTPFRIRDGQASPPVRKEAPGLRIRGRAISAMAAALAIVLSAAWTTLGSYATIRIKAPPFSSEMRELPELFYLGPSGSEGDVRVVRSPILFSLPTRHGFSGALQPEPDQQLSIPLAAEHAVFLLPAPDLNEHMFGETSRSLESLIQKARPLRVPTGEEEDGVVSWGGSREKSLCAFWRDLPGAMLEGLSLSDLPGALEDASWEAHIFVAYDRQGLVRQVLVDQPAPRWETTEALIRLARGLKGPRTGSVVHRTLIVRYAPPPGIAR